MGAPAITPNLFKLESNPISVAGLQEQEEKEVKDPFLKALMEFLAQQERTSQPGILGLTGSQLQLSPHAGGIGFDQQQQLQQR